MLYRMVKKETQRIQAILLCAIALSVTAPVQAQMMRQGAGQAMTRGASRADSAVVGKVAYSGNWINRQIESKRKSFPIWARRRVAGLFRRFVTPREQELQVMSNWINHGSLSSQEQKVWNQYKRRVYSSRGAIAAIVGVVVAILAAIAGTAIGVSRRRAAQVAQTPALITPALITPAPITSAPIVEEEAVEVAQARRVAQDARAAELQAAGVIGGAAAASEAVRRAFLREQASLPFKVGDYVVYPGDSFREDKIGRVVSMPSTGSLQVQPGIGYAFSRPASDFRLATPEEIKDVEQKMADRKAEDITTERAEEVMRRIREVAELGIPQGLQGPEQGLASPRIDENVVEISDDLDD